MPYRYGPFERVVGGFLLLSLALLVGLLGLWAYQKQWWKETLTFYTQSQSAGQLLRGSSVVLSGIKIGEVTALDLLLDGQIKVTFNIEKNYEGHLRQGSEVHFVRPFIIGEKILEIKPGPLHEKKLKPLSFIKAQESMDLIQMVGGPRLPHLLEKVETALVEVSSIMSEGKKWAHTLNQDQQVLKTLQNLTYVTNELTGLMKQTKKHGPEWNQKMSTLVDHLNAIGQGMREIAPVMVEVSKTLPEGSQKAMQALEESVVVLRAMQKSFLLKGSVEEVREEDHKRVPAHVP